LLAVPAAPDALPDELPAEGERGPVATGATHPIDSGRSKSANVDDRIAGLVI
jgi:hypothetical protein